MNAVWRGNYPRRSSVGVSFVCPNSWGPTFAPTNSDGGTLSSQCRASSLCGGLCRLNCAETCSFCVCPNLTGALSEWDKTRPFHRWQKACFLRPSAACWLPNRYFPEFSFVSRLCQAACPRLLLTDWEKSRKSPYRSDFLFCWVFAHFCHNCSQILPDLTTWDSS